MMRITHNLLQITAALRQGDVIAYPTEGVFGLGCDPFNAEAVSKLLQIKQRSPTRGLILVSDSWDSIADLTLPIEPKRLEKVLATWPGAITWVFPASEKVPAWICGDFGSVAVRISNHPVVNALCEAFGGPIVSTSANREGEAPALNAETLQQYFSHESIWLLAGKLGETGKPTPIFDVLTGKQIRD